MPFLDQAQVRKFDEQGFLVVENILDREEDIQPLEDEYTAHFDAMIERWYANGEISDKYEGLSLGKRASAVMGERLSIYPDFDISLPFNLTETTEMHLGPAVFNLLRNPRLLDVIESLMGSEIYSNPVQHVRIKPPEDTVPPELRTSLTAAVGWHQDAGVVLPEADNTGVISCWLAITEATLDNSCLLMVPGSHRGEVALHCFDKVKMGAPGVPQLQIPERYREPVAVPVPLHAGDAVFFHRRTMHSSGKNVSDDWRWSFDLRYNPIGMPTGRDWFPGFVARSRANPETELKDYREWAQLWLDTRNRLAHSQMPAFLRWQKDDPRCA